MTPKSSIKTLSLLLCLLMIMSAFVAVPVGAESEAQSPVSDESSVLWSLDFDDYDDYVEANSGATLKQYMATKGITLYNDSTNLAKLSISDGKIKSARSLWFHNYSGADDAFGNLLYGMYSDEEGNAVTDYFMDIDYTLVTPRETKTFTFTGTENGKTVTYVISTPYRGDSYFNPMSGGGYGVWFFKVSPTGYLYTADNFSTQTFKTADGADDNLGYFTYTKKVDGGTTSAKAPVTKAVWEEMRANCGKDKVSLDSKGAEIFNNMHDYTTDNAYQLEVGKEYTIRVKMSVASNKTVTATTYVRPKDGSEAFVKVGSVSYKCSIKNNAATEKSIRFSENYHDYTFDNIAFKLPSSCGENHDFLTVEIVSGTNGFESYKRYSCFSCGAEWYDYRDENVLKEYDFTTLTDINTFTQSADYKSAKNMTLVEGKGLSFKAGELHIHTPMVDMNKDYRLSFTMQLNQISGDQTGGVGSSFLTDVTGGSFDMFLRFGRNADYDTTKEGWLKIRTKSNDTNWSSMPTAYTLKDGETYDFEVVLRPSASEFDLYINGAFVGSGWIPSREGATVRDIRIANQYNANFVLENYSISQIEPYKTYTLMNGTGGGFSFDRSTVSFGRSDTYGALATNVIEASGKSTALIINDRNKVLGDGVFNLSFDFLMTDTGEYKDSVNTDAAIWSLASWLNSDSAGTTYYGTMARIGGIDNDASKPGFERFFVVMENNNVSTSSTDNGNQSYTTSAGGEVAGYYSDHNSVYTFEAGEWVTFTFSVNTPTNSVYLYANGELVGMAPIGAINSKHYSGGSVLSQLRIGDAFRKFFYNWAVKDIELELADAPAEVKDSGTIFNMNFGGAHKVSGGVTAKLGSASMSAVTEKEYYRDNGATEGYTRFTANAGNFANGTTNLFNLSLTSTVGDSYYNHLDGSKYAIETTFALYDREVTEQEIADLKAYNEEKGKNLSLPKSLRGNNVSILRMSKYHDDNKVVLIHHNADGVNANTVDGIKYLYVRNENGEMIRPCAWYNAEQLVDGRIPENVWVKVKAVVDESTGTYSVFVNDTVAYYLEGGVYKRAENLKFAVDTSGKNSFITKYPNAPETIAWLAQPSYSTLPRTVTNEGQEVAYGTSGLSLVSYLRFFQGALDFSVKNVSVTKIDESLEFVGTQTRKNDGSFDVRFVFGTDDIYVDGIEYDVSASVNGVDKGETLTAISKTAYRAIKADGKNINSWKLDEGDYLTTFTVDGVELAGKSTLYTFKITPYLTEYNQAKGVAERNIASANITHVVTLNGLGEMVSYGTESAEWADLKTQYTKITDVPHKTLGRTQLLDGALLAEWSGAGLEFEANCIGSVSINVNAPYTRLFTIVVDGVEYKDVGIGMGDNIIAQNLPYGKHSFKIMNQAGYNGIIEINGVTIRGEYLDAPDYSELLIEFIGDSITHGAGLGSPDYSEGINDGTLTYAFLAAKELGADYTIMANGGMGVLWGADYAEDNLNRSMKKYPYLNDSKRGDALYTGYMRAADLVVIGLSTNDNFRFSQQYTAEKNAFKAANPTASTEAIDAHMTEFVESKMALLKAELETLIAEIEKNHSKDVPIILARGMMEYDDPIYLTSVTYMTKFIEEDWQGQYGDHVIKVAHLTPDRTGVGGHPKREGAAKQGAELAEFIRTEFPELVPAK